MDKPIHVLAVVASQAGGNTDRLVGLVLKAASETHTGVSSSTVHLGAGPLDQARVESDMRSLAAADAVVLGTPMFRSTYAAVLKEFLERVPRGGPPDRFDGPLRAKAVGIVATGGSHHHFLGADPHRLAAWMGDDVLPLRCVDGAPGPRRVGVTVTDGEPLVIGT